MKTYRAAVIGCGRKASTIDDTKPFFPNYNYLPVSHAAAYAHLPNVELVAAAALSSESVQTFGERWGVSARYTDYRQMLKKERPDIVSVLTHAPLHAEMTIAAAEAGAIGVYCEKAMACSLDETDAMIAACEKAGSRLMVGYPRRWYLTFSRAKAALDAGLIGELKSVFAGGSGGVIHNATHTFDLMRYFAGEVAAVSGILHPGSGGGYPEDMEGQAWLQFASGVAGFVDNASGLGLALRLGGDRGSIFIDPAIDGYSLSVYNGAGEQGDAALREVGAAKQTSHIPNEPASGSTTSAMVADFVAWIEGGPPVRCTGEDGRAALEIGLAIHASHRQGGNVVPLPLEDRALRVESR